MGSELRFADVLRRLQSKGWQLARVAGSHHIFVRKGKPLLSIPVKQNKVKPCYAKKIDQACDEV